MTANRGEVLVAADGEALARIAAHLVRAELAAAAAQSGVARIAISGGTTPRVMNRILATLSLPWDRIEWFQVDERFVPYDNPRSNFGAAKDDLFGPAHVPDSHVHPMPVSPTPDEAARAYEATLRRVFAGDPLVFDLVLLGIGDDGHTASLFPGEDTVDVTDRWVAGVPAGKDREPRVTLTRPMITAARRVFVIAQGEKKKEPIRRARGEGALRDTPSRLTQEVQGTLLFLVDEAARP